MTTAVSTTQLAALAELHPEIDWDAVMAAQRSAPQEVADTLIAAGCDPDAVKRLIFHS